MHICKALVNVIYRDSLLNFALYSALFVTCSTFSTLGSIHTYIGILCYTLYTTLITVQQNLTPRGEKFNRDDFCAPYGTSTSVGDRGVPLCIPYHDTLQTVHQRGHQVESWCSVWNPFYYISISNNFQKMS